LGTLPLLLVWIFLNIVSLLIGFELNVSIMSARKQKASEDELPDAEEILEKK
jgi:uncharacterized BrkB/YihY/UPF0761 family membrane protein